MQPDDEHIDVWVVLGAIATMVLLAVVIWAIIPHQGDIHDGPAAVWRNGK